MKTRSVILTLLLFLMIVDGCKKEEDPPETTAPVVTTLPVIKHPVTNLAEISATCAGKILSDGGAIILSRGLCWGISPDITTDSANKHCGKGTGKFTCQLDSLEPFTNYYVRAWATNSKGTTYGNPQMFFTETPELSPPCPGTPTVTDLDGNVYKTVQIGNQCWLKENLKTTKYSNGMPIPVIRDKYAWLTIGQTGAMAWMNHDSATYAATYGALYSWYTTVHPNGLCPQGWHVPSDTEWVEMEFLIGTPENQLYWKGGRGMAGLKLKERGTEHWQIPNKDANNLTGFTGLPGGAIANTNGLFWELLRKGTWWTTTSDSTNIDEAWTRELFYDYSSIVRWDRHKGLGYSVRCIKNP
jgi:uncharacterized protein (TIGR02145 family)